MKAYGRAERGIQAPGEFVQEVTASVGHGYDVRVLRTVDELAAMREAWDALQVHPNADLDAFLTTLDTLGPEASPHVVFLTRGGHVTAMMVGLILRTTVEIAMGYKTLFSAPVRMMRFAPGALQGDISGAAAEAFVDELLRCLREGEADVVRLFELPLESKVFDAARARPGFLSRDYAIAPGPHWSMAMPACVDDFYRRLGRKHRPRLRRMCRMMEGENPDKLSYHLFRGADEVERFCGEAEEIARKTYQRITGGGFTDNEESRGTLARWAQAGRWRATILYVDGQPCAYWTGRFQGDVFYFDYTGHDPAHNRFRPGPGTMLFAKTIEKLLEEGQLRKLDFGFGRYTWKKRFGDSCREEATVMIFAPTLYGRGVNAARTVFFVLEKLMKWALDTLGVRNRVKRLWREHLAGAGAARGANEQIDPRGAKGD